MTVGANLLHTLYDGRDPLAPAFRFAGQAPRTVAELRASTGRFASALRSLGVKRGDRVSLKLDKSEEVLFLAHACMQLGAIVHPLNTAYTVSELGFLVGDAEPRLLVCHPDEASRLAACGAQIQTLAPGLGGTLGDRAAAADPLAEIVAVEPDETAALLYTSGTTGKPKGACITHRNLAESAKALARVWGLQPSDRLAHALPMYHAHGLLTSVNSMMAAGAAIDFLPRFDAHEMLAVLPQATVLMGVPTHYARLNREGRALGAATRGLKLAISGSAPLSGEIAEEFRALTGRTIIERYGATETAIVTAVPAGVTDRSGFVGWALPGVEIRVGREDGTRADRSAIGELETRGHNVFGGYWRRPDADGQALAPDGWFCTGDIAEIDASGCVRLLGRSKDLIISGGLNVYPREVEAALDALLGRETAVFGVPHPDFGEAVVAVVETGQLAPDEPTIVGRLRQTLAAYKTPKRIIPVASIPRNRMGKVLKTELRDAFKDLFTPTTT